MGSRRAGFLPLDFGADIVPVQQHGEAVGGTERQIHRPRRRDDGGQVVQRDAATPHRHRQGAVNGAAVQVIPPQTLRQSTADRALAGAAGTVDGEYRR